MSIPNSYFGGNFDVYSQLESIEFSKGAGDLSLRGDTAYIRPWRRGGTGTVDSARAIDAGAGTTGGLWNFATDWAKTYGLTPFDGTSNFVEGSSPPVFDGAAATSALSRVLPTSDIEMSFLPARRPTGASVESVGTSIFNPPTSGKKGAVVVLAADPNQNISRFSRSRVEDRSTGNAAPVGASSDQSSSGTPIWQFLFNPSEMELEASPEYKTSEVWAVSDKANSGQPVHWTGNKNALLKFNSVLLNGFVFARKVDALEQGLLELFMARGDAGQHGPTVLEFVWGKRVFGPCVIKNINVKEKMWDEGFVVNAEVSFTLEQIPEWTVNDGAFVDVARPGKIGTDPKPTDTPAGNPEPAKTEAAKKAEEAKKSPAEKKKAAEAAKKAGATKPAPKPSTRP